MSVVGKAGTRFGVGCLSLFFLPFLGVGIFMTVLIARDVLKSMQTLEWSAVPATIQHAEVIKEVSHTSDGESVSYRIESAYTYEWQGQPRQGTRVSVNDSGGFGLAARTRATRLNNAIREGGDWTAFADPDAPHEAVLFRSPMWDSIIFMGLFAVVFGGVGIGGLIGMAYLWRRQKTVDQRKRLYPDEPWKWNSKWDSGIIYTSGKAHAAIFTGFAAVWNIIAWPLAIAMSPEYESGNRLSLLALIFPAVGLLLAAGAWSSWRRHRRFGKAIFRLTSLPGVIGGKLQGVVEIPHTADLSAQAGQTITLQCLERTTSGSGRNSSTQTRMLWESSRPVDIASTRGRMTTVPVSFTIPFSCRESSQEMLSGPAITWKLSIEQPGKWTRASFDVPVFKTPASDPSVTEQRVDEEELAELTPDFRSSKIRIEQSAHGDLRLRVPSMLARAPSLVAGFLIFAAIWTGAIIFMSKMGAPLFLIVIFSGIDVILIAVVLSFVLISTTSTFTDREVTIERSFGLFTQRKHIAINSITSVKREIGMSTESGSKKTSYYDLKIEYAEGKKASIVTGVKDKTHVQFVASLVRDKLGLADQAVTDDKD